MSNSYIEIIEESLSVEELLTLGMEIKVSGVSEQKIRVGAFQKSLLLIY